jgi:hypothetical protein
MEKRRKSTLIGSLFFLALLLVGSWYFSRDSLACTHAQQPQGSGARLNKYRTCMVNGVSGVARFLQEMPDSFSATWQKAQTWVWEMRYPFTVGGNQYIKWPQQQGDNVDTVVMRPHAGIAATFMEAYKASDDTVYRNHAREVTKYLKLNDPEHSYVVMHEITHEDFGDMVYWNFWDANGTPCGQIRYSYDGGISAIGISFLTMYAASKTAADSDTFYDAARRAAQYIKYVAVTGTTDDTLWAKWTINNDAQNPVYASGHCEGAAGIVTFLDSMYVFADDSDSTTDLQYARAGLRWLENEAQDTTINDVKHYWWYQYPSKLNDPENPDSSYSPVWGRGAAGISETFLMGYEDLTGASQTLQDKYWGYAEGAAKWVHLKAETYSGGYRWRYMFKDPDESDTIYYTYFCKGQGPVISFFAHMYDEAADKNDSDSTLYYDTADSGRVYLDATKVEGYEGEGVYIWDGKDVVPEWPDSDYIPISVSIEGGPPGLGRAMLQAAKTIGSEQSPNSSFMSLAYHCANWLKAEYHADSVLGGYKWFWNTAEDSFTVEIRNKSYCNDPCTLDVNDAFECSLFVYNKKNASATVFWWVDFLRWNKGFTFYDGDSGTVTIAAGDTEKVYIWHPLASLENLPQNVKLVSVNGNVGYWIPGKYDTLLFSMDHDCFRVYVVDEKE